MDGKEWEGEEWRRKGKEEEEEEGRERRRRRKRKKMVHAWRPKPIHYLELRRWRAEEKKLRRRKGCTAGGGRR